MEDIVDFVRCVVPDVFAETRGFSWAAACLGVFFYVVVCGLPGGFRCCLVLAAAVAAWRLAVAGACGLSYMARIVPWGLPWLSLIVVSLAGGIPAVRWLIHAVGY
ncbi:hypothetical protein CQR48_1754 [Bifidobacterium thermophilum]|nr:hypothetical protein CQR48_1754 [Bifidobacterium thermophilum]